MLRNRTLTRAISAALQSHSKSTVSRVPKRFHFHYAASNARLLRTPLAMTLPRFMSGVVNVPLESLGESISSAVLVEWQKKAGDAVSVDDVVAVVETDKVTMDIRAKESGVFGEAFVEAGGEVSVGSNLYSLDTDGSASATNNKDVQSSDSSCEVSATTSEENSSSSQGARIQVDVPSMGESITQGVLASWNVSPGENVESGDVLAIIETDKVSVDVIAQHTGKLVEVFAAAGDEVDVGKPLYIIEEGAGGSKKPATDSAPKENAKKPEPEPSAPKQESKPTSTEKSDPAKSSSPTIQTSPTGGNSTNDRSETRVKMTRMRQRIAQRLKEAQNTAAMLTTFQEVDMGPLMDMRNKHKDEFQKVHGVKLGFMSAFVKASAAALVEIPAINGRIDDASKEIVYHNYVDISVAVASPTGLVVPVLRNCENMSFADIEKTIGMYSQKAKDGSMAIEDMAGGTFTISNGGVFGSLYGTPIINPPQSAILGMHATKMRAVVVNGKVEARPMMYLALTYDHRLIDGREAVTFLKSLQGKIEDPSRILLDL